MAIIGFNVLTGLLRTFDPERRPGLVCLIKEEIQRVEALLARVHLLLLAVCKQRKMFAHV